MVNDLNKNKLLVRSVDHICLTRAEAETVEQAKSVRIQDLNYILDFLDTRYWDIGVRGLTRLDSPPPR